MIFVTIQRGPDRFILSLVREGNQLLTLARTEGGEVAHQKHEPLDFAQLVREVVEDWVMAALEKDIDLGYEADGPAMILGNPFLLRELAKNLIDNALRYTPNGGHVTVRVLATPATVPYEAMTFHPPSAGTAFEALRCVSVDQSIVSIGTEHPYKQILALSAADTN